MVALIGVGSVKTGAAVVGTDSAQGQGGVGRTEEWISGDGKGETWGGEVRGRDDDSRSQLT